MECVRMCSRKVIERSIFYSKKNMRSVCCAAGDEYNLG